MKYVAWFFILSGVVFAQIPSMKKFPLLNNDSSYYTNAAVQNDNVLHFFWTSGNKLLTAQSSDHGASWNGLKIIDEHPFYNLYRELSAVAANNGRIFINQRQRCFYSDDNGASWVQLNSFPSTGINNNLSIIGNSIYCSYTKGSSSIYFKRTSDSGITWSNETAISPHGRFGSIASAGTNLVAVYISNNNIVSRISSDNGNNWSTETKIISTSFIESRSRLINDNSGNLWLSFVRDNYIFPNITQKDIFYIKSSDGGLSWSDENKFTSFTGMDDYLHLSLFNGKPLISFSSDRINTNQSFNNHLYYGILNETVDTSPPYLNKHEIYNPEPKWRNLTIRAYVSDNTGISSVLMIDSAETSIDTAAMFDDGTNGDSLAADNIYSYRYDNLDIEEHLIYFAIADIDQNEIQVKGPEFQANLLSTVESSLFNINKVILPFSNAGILADVSVNVFTGGKYDEAYFLFSGGFFLSGKDNNELWANGAASAYRIQDYLPGKVGQSVFNPLTKIYTIKSSDPHFGTSWQEWINAVQQGADFYDGNNDSIYNPVDLNGNGVWDLTEDSPGTISELTAFTVFNDAMPAEYRRFNDVDPKGIEIQQTLFGSNINSQINNIIYIRYRIINRGTVSSLLDSVYFSIWTDPDLGAYFDDLVGSDTTLNSGYVYNDGDDEQYGINPPSFFTQLVQGAPSFIPGETFIDNNGNGTYEHGIDTPLDSAKNNKGLFLGSDVIPGAKNSIMNSFVHYFSSHPTHGDPYTKEELRNYVLGFDKVGDLLDPCNWPFGLVAGGVNCQLINPLFSYSGDPTTNYGWINGSPLDQRMMANTGPFTLKENEPVDIIVAYVIGRGSEHLNSITKARNNAEYALAYYNNNFTFLPPVGVEDEVALANNFQLYQNYPNPFNPTTNIKFSVASAGMVTLRVYDILGREVTTLVNDMKFPGDYTVEFNGNRFASGVYFYELRAGDFVQRKKMILIK